MKGPFIILFYLAFFISTPVIIFFHELGHALFALLYTDDEVKVFVESHGKTTGGFHFKLKRIHFYFDFTLLKWKSGLCIHSYIKKTYQRIILILAGPLLPVIIAGISLKAAFDFGGDNIIVTAMFFTFFAVISMLYNLIPRKEPVVLHDGTITYNDGKQILNAIKYYPLEKEYAVVVEHCKNKNHREAVDELQRLIEKYSITDSTTFFLGVLCYYKLNDIDGMKQFLTTYESRTTFDVNEYFNIGVYFSKFDEYKTSIEYYKKSLAIKETANALNNIGYSLNLTGYYIEALEYFNKAIIMEPDHAYGYNNRGYSKLKLGLTEEGFKDFEKSYALDPNNSYYFKNLGLYHYSKLEYEKSLELFLKAKEMDSTTYKIDNDIEMAHSAIYNNYS